MVESVRQLIETTASHLIDQVCTLDNVLQRYARITRVHVMCILRSTGSGKYSKWYRDQDIFAAYFLTPDSHYFHHTITKQPPPDLSESENILVIMFGMGKFFFNFIFFTFGSK